MNKEFLNCVMYFRDLISNRPTRVSVDDVCDELQSKIAQYPKGSLQRAILTNLLNDWISSINKHKKLVRVDEALMECTVTTRDN